jgi:hypothetical protein
VRLGRQEAVGNTFCKIVFDGSRLSISGVEGPLQSGNCRGGCGQIDMHADQWRFAEYAPGWSAETVARFVAVWGEWHLNDLRAYDAAMKRDGWHNLARREMLGFEFVLTSEASADKKAAESAALAALRAGEPFEPSPSQYRAAVRPYSATVWVYADQPEPKAPGSLAYDAGAYERARDLWGHNKGGVKPPERKTLGWLKPSDHADGLLTKKHPETGNGYGSGWYREDVPTDVLEWLSSLPDADIKPAWV